MLGDLIYSRRYRCGTYNIKRIGLHDNNNLTLNGKACLGRMFFSSVSCKKTSVAWSIVAAQSRWWLIIDYELGYVKDNGPNLHARKHIT